MHPIEAEIQRQSIIRKFCHRCKYFWFDVKCQSPRNKNNEVVAECPYFEEIKPLDIEG